MKKLTAGIFTVILGLTTVDAFAAIPTQAYVDSAIEYALEQAEAAVYNDTAIKADIAANATAVQSAAAAAAAAQTAADAAQGDVDTLSGKVGTVPADKTVVQMISEAQSSATYNDTEVRGLITAAQTQANKGVTDAAAAAAAAAAAKTQADKGVADAATAAAAAAQAQATADSKLAVTGTCPAGKTCYLDSTGAIQVAVDTFDSSKLNGASTN